MKRSLAIVLAAAVLLLLAACGSKKQPAASPNTQSAPVAAEPDDVTAAESAAALRVITDDFTDTTAELTQKLDETFAAVGMTYADYQKNKGLIDEWVALVLSESDALFARTKEHSITYFKQIAAEEDHSYSEFCSDALEQYYDTVCNDALDIYYDALYSKALDTLYDTYYGGLLDEAYDDIPYQEWSNASSACYQVWSDASSAVYQKWSDESSYLYGLWSAVDSAFCWDDNFDVDAIVAAYDTEQEEDRTEEEAEVSSEDESDAADQAAATPSQANPAANATDETAIRDDFKAAMDSYEAFIDEYVAFLQKYTQNPTDLSLLNDYATYMSKYADLAAKFDAWESEDLNTAELAYYLEVQSRVSQKLLAVS